MNEQFSHYIEKYGGKNGSLLYLREKEEFQEHVLPLEILDMTEKFSNASWKAIKAACKQLGLERVIVRSSCAPDFRGGVDVMKTLNVPLDHNRWFGGKIVDAIKEVREACFNKDLIRYFEAEGAEYDPTKSTISVAPYIPNVEVHTITEHPTQEGIILVDMTDTGKSDYEQKVETYDVINGAIKKVNPEYAMKSDDMLSPSVEQKIRRYLDVIEKVQDTGLIPNKEAWQWEMGGHKGKPIIFQPRFFSDKKKADFVLNEKDPNVFYSTRNMGITSATGLTHRMLEALFAQSVSQFQEFYDDEYFAVIHRNSKKLTLNEKTNGMKGFFPHGKTALTHNLTRYAQAVLKNNGVVSLGIGANDKDKALMRLGIREITDRWISSGLIEYAFEGEPFRITCDGARMKVEDLEPEEEEE